MFGKTAPCNRKYGTGCPMCSGRVATPSTSLAALSPELAREWHSTANGDLRPRDVRPAAYIRVRWQEIHGEDEILLFDKK